MKPKGTKDKVSYKDIDIARRVMSQDGELFKTIPQYGNYGGYGEDSCFFDFYEGNDGLNEKFENQFARMSLLYLRRELFKQINAVLESNTLISKNRKEADKAEMKKKYFYVITERFGLFSGEEKTLEEIAIDLKITRERVRQLELKVFKELRKKCEYLKVFL
jgi:DNA-directed RNA polymerase sigma subunit (sigma70/sigma32)